MRPTLDATGISNKMGLKNITKVISYTTDMSKKERLGSTVSGEERNTFIYLHTLVLQAFLLPRF